MSNEKEQPKFSYRKLSDLEPLENNPRTITDDDLEKLVSSIRDNQDYFEARPLILSDRTGKLIIIAGNQRYKAAKLLGMKEAPTFLISGLTEEREKEIIIRDNVSNGEWKWETLKTDWDLDELGDWGLEPPKQYVLNDAPAGDTSLDPPKFYINIKSEDQMAIEGLLDEIEPIVDRYNVRMSVNSD